MAVVGSGEVDALFISDAAGRRLITLNGADRAYRLLVEGMADGALTLTADGVVAWCNRSFATLLGRPLNRLIGTRVDLCFAPESRASLAALLSEQQDVKRYLAIDLLTDAGQRVPVYLSVNPSVVDGLPEALCMVVTDLTEQRRSEADRLSRQHLLEVIEDQRRTQQQLQLSLAALGLRDRALGAISQGVMITDAQSKVTYANAAFEAMSGYSAADMLGRSSGILQGPQTDAQVVRTIRRAVAAALPFHGELLNYRKDGQPFWNELSITPIFDPGGEPIQFVGVLRDVTERKQADQARQSLEAQLREAQKMEAIGTLAGGIAHDFNNILGSMLGNLGLASQTLVAGHAANALLDQVRMGGERARSLVEQILAFSRRQPTLLRAQPLEPIVREALDLLRATLPATVRLELAVAAGPQPIILCDTTQVQQIVINLCTNAWQSLSGSTGCIKLGIDAEHIAASASQVLPPGDYVHLRVTDTGQGMDFATQARIFEPFFSTKVPGQGTGLGLAVVHGIVASHHGHIAVSSRRGGGTTFDLHFPVTDALPANVSMPTAPDEAALGQGPRVMYIDDDELMLLMVGRLLERLGYRATCVSDPAVAVATVLAQPGAFDVVVTDYNMPPMSGLDVVRALREGDADLPVAISSGFISDELRGAAAELGVVELLRKEHTLEELGPLLGRLLAQ
ncbi:MAG TPA: PAS domain-containing protein [Ideonella sp.]|uniref:PAS domain-containing hybrid sensor histidine kinase/response regulator n=1 Tax=Ideonella sp. TaxID=1929293 RepID=UPI002CC4477F|nr:PAS domain-containing protein [Ideonella sp.]HSI47469.1 PAS domain-containing protein [Ideonella sp.]